MSNDFGKRISIEEVEEGTSFAPKFDEKGLIPVITVEDSTSEILMLATQTKKLCLKQSKPTKLIIGAEVEKKSGKKVKPVA